MSRGYANSAVDLAVSGNFKLPWVNVSGGCLFVCLFVWSLNFIFHYSAAHSSSYSNFPVVWFSLLNTLKPELNPICYLLALLAHHFLHVSRIRVKLLTFRQLMSYIYIYMYVEHPFLMFLDHTQRRSTVGRTPLDE